MQAVPSPLPLARLVARGVALVGLAALGVAVGVTLLDIALSLGESGIAGEVDIVQLCVMAGAWLAMPLAFLDDAHVSVDLLSGRLPHRAGLALKGFGELLSVALMALVLRYGWDTAQQQLTFGDVSQEIGIPIIWYWAPLLAGAALSILAALLVALADLAAALKGAPR
ncbi:TRAP-type C4-dicarboxylate transport system, small permease component [Tistlia consotensis]|uniref:TRAP transporter small permease protein n=1 Tax=Tistlia consotensis USBA 355 TaxID=560819 RepID=A0A1Y6BNY2_9PROT|nr:TRAP transporter small permease subunit [Tistlia consotensis]SMF13358.1 TRAP-type C4-dicarboxylate transport system, small permease component [Tistlia consotensis USBA 355]SNR50557.1 TRAP-type C4-dicarboxylate transport system, small permease component [Tistlia consotensis]